MGGGVEGMGEYEIGYRTVEHDGESVLLDGVDEQMTVFTSHADHVVQKPPGATVFARNECGIHGFRKGQVFAVQFHPEYDMETATAVTREKDTLPEKRTQEVLAGISTRNYEAACEAKALFDNFIGFVEDIDETQPQPR